MIEHRVPTSATQKHVLSASGNQCAFPGCSRPIFDLTHETLIGTIAHIAARSEGGRRFDPEQSEENSRAFGNLVAMCSEHSKIIDGPKWSDFSFATLTGWKRDHEQRIEGDADRSWIRPPNSITRFESSGECLHFSYWIDRHGRPRAFTSHQLSQLNARLALKLFILKLAALPGLLEESKNVDVKAFVQQDSVKFNIHVSVIADPINLMTMTSFMTFAEFLGFLIGGNDPTRLIQDGARRIHQMSEGEADPVVKSWFGADKFSPSTLEGGDEVKP